MKYCGIILGLATVGFAIDARIHLDNQYCEGRWIGCLNLNPDTCCSISSSGPSSSFVAVPKDWRIQTRSYVSQNCGTNNQGLANMVNMDYLCVPAYQKPNYQSVGYGFLGRKAKRENEEGCVRSNALGLGDGTIYNLTAMDDGLVNDLVGMTEAKGAADIPKLFKKFQM